MKTIEEIHKECQKIFEDSFFGEQQGQSSACKIYDKLTEGDEKKQDCLGENFNQLLHRVNDNWFKSYKPTNDIDYYFFNYILLLYLFVERVDLVFDIISEKGKTKLFNDFNAHNFKTLRKINKWANFVKHPKEFLFTHWAQYYFSEERIQLSEGDVKIDTDFIMKHYFGEKNERPIILQNNDKVYVEIPDLVALTRDFGIEMNAFFDFICANQIVADFLKKKSTIENYYSVDETNAQTNNSSTDNT